MRGKRIMRIFDMRNPLRKEIDKLKKENKQLRKKLKKQKINGWVILKGRPIFSCKTRKQAREYAKKYSVNEPIYNYVGKCINDYHTIILDV